VTWTSPADKTLFLAETRLMFSVLRPNAFATITGITDEPPVWWYVLGYSRPPFGTRHMEGVREAERARRR
jgi:hypothetical protein